MGKKIAKPDGFFTLLFNPDDLIRSKIIVINQRAEIYYRGCDVLKAINLSNSGSRVYSGRGIDPIYLSEEVSPDVVSRGIAYLDANQVVALILRTASKVSQHNRDSTRLQGRRILVPVRAEAVPDIQAKSCPPHRISRFFACPDFPIRSVLEYLCLQDIMRMLGITDLPTNVARKFHLEVMRYNQLSLDKCFHGKLLFIDRNNTFKLLSGWFRKTRLPLSDELKLLRRQVPTKNIIGEVKND